MPSIGNRSILFVMQIYTMNLHHKKHKCELGLSVKILIDTPTFLPPQKVLNKWPWFHAAVLEIMLQALEFMYSFLWF